MTTIAYYDINLAKKLTTEFGNSVTCDVVAQHKASVLHIKNLKTPHWHTQSFKS